MDDYSFRRIRELQTQPIGLFRLDMHELGNLIVALQFCLRQLGGRQRTDELEGIVRAGLQVCEQGIAAFRKVDEAVRIQR